LCGHKRQHFLKLCRAFALALQEEALDGRTQGIQSNPCLTLSRKKSLARKNPGDESRRKSQEKYWSKAPHREIATHISPPLPRKENATTGT
jgi:hypothetical protein